MDSVRTFDSATTLTICEGCDVKKPERIFKKRCNCCDCFRRTSSFRVWQILLVLLVIAIIFAGLGLAMFRTGKDTVSRSHEGK